LTKPDKKNQDNGGTRGGDERRRNPSSGRNPDRRSGRDRRKGSDRRSNLGRRRHLDNGAIERRDVFKEKV
jgi:hypothetical protein